MARNSKPKNDPPAASEQAAATPVPEAQVHGHSARMDIAPRTTAGPIEEAPEREPSDLVGQDPTKLKEWARADTGWFPSYDARRRPRLDGDGKHLKELRLRNIKDGSVRSFVDDGGSSVEANQQRQQLIRSLLKVDDESGLPVFFADKPVSPAALPTPIGAIRIPTFNAAIGAVMLDRISDRRRGYRLAAERLRREGDSLGRQLGSTHADVLPRPGPAAPAEGAEGGAA